MCLVREIKQAMYPTALDVIMEARLHDCELVWMMSEVLNYHSTWLLLMCGWWECYCHHKLLTKQVLYICVYIYKWCVIYYSIFHSIFVSLIFKWKNPITPGRFFYTRKNVLNYLTVPLELEFRSNYARITLELRSNHFEHARNGRFSTVISGLETEIYLCSSCGYVVRGIPGCMQNTNSYLFFNYHIHTVLVQTLKRAEYSTGTTAAREYE